MEINARIEKDGINVDVDNEQKLKHLWRSLQRSEAMGNMLVNELAQLRNQYDTEMDKIAKNMATVRNMAEDREAAMSVLKEEIRNMKMRLNQENTYAFKDLKDEIDKVLISEGFEELISKDAPQKLRALMLEFEKCKDLSKEIKNENLQLQQENKHLKNDCVLKELSRKEIEKEMNDLKQELIFKESEKEEAYRLEIMAMKDSKSRWEKSFIENERKVKVATEMITNLEKKIEVEKINHQHEVQEITKSFEGIDCHSF